MWLTKIFKKKQNKQNFEENIDDNSYEYKNYDIADDRPAYYSYKKMNIGDIEKISFADIKSKNSVYDWEYKYTNTIVPLGADGICVKPFISYNEQSYILKECVDAFLEDNEDLSQNNLLDVKTLYNILVIQFCTNIDMEDGILDDIYNNDLIRDIVGYVYNYNDLWNTIIESINHQVIIHSLGLFSKTLPTQEKIETTARLMQASIQEMNDKNPDLLKFIIQNKLQDATIEEARKEFEVDKAKKKTEVLNSKSIDKKATDIVDSVLEGR